MIQSKFNTAGDNVGKDGYTVVGFRPDHKIRYKAVDDLTAAAAAAVKLTLSPASPAGSGLLGRAGWAENLGMPDAVILGRVGPETASRSRRSGEVPTSVAAEQ